MTALIHSGYTSDTWIGTVLDDYLNERLHQSIAEGWVTDIGTQRVSIDDRKRPGYSSALSRHRSQHDLASIKPLDVQLETWLSVLIEAMELRYWFPPSMSTEWAGSCLWCSLPLPVLHAGVVEVTTARGAAVCQFLNIQPEIFVAFAFNRTSIVPEVVTKEGGVVAEKVFVYRE
jgi:hypothetical protein